MVNTAEKDEVDYRAFVVTDRLIVWKASAGDAELNCSLWTDPRVMSFDGFPNGLDITLQEVRARIMEDEQDPSPFDTLLVAQRKAEAAAIGQC